MWTVVGLPLLDGREVTMTDLNQLDAEQIKEQICEIGRRLWQRQLVAGIDGNITVRLTENEILCTPTMHSKGFLEPTDICLVNLAGEQLSGAKRRSSEILLHLEILKARSDVLSVVHSHPPHATAFAISGRPVPLGLLAEAEFFLGDVPVAPYEMPGTATFARTVLPFVHRSNACILANHGAVTYGASLIDAYNLMEVLDSYCRIVLLADSLGSPQTLSDDQRAALAQLRVQSGVAPLQPTPTIE
ncbi:class II aldolase/adducin family protein [Bythopirellula polymerisocia]|uniref:Methylthioribulose-1-phosphate dehydratase n=1 Tax=Bythopirellula polymerisocia TaxID=2528003 RepID=A0A5C6CSN0_9BACT|nr:class II aldolase/adducin family protein [Bythopirellula polymerisocia]TWU26096.1 Methylthioribulose-1-phosphate dehydratase [Bythopirellula polymerisocia]